MQDFLKLSRTMEVVCNFVRSLQAHCQEQLHAVLVLLSIRALGKSKAILNQLPKSQRRGTGFGVGPGTHLQGVL